MPGLSGKLALHAWMLGTIPLAGVPAKDIVLVPYSDVPPAPPPTGL